MKSGIKDRTGDVYNRIMKKYDSVPQWWFCAIFVTVLGLSILTCEGFDKKLQLPYWGILLAIAVGLVFTLPIGVITATTNQVISLSLSAHAHTHGEVTLSLTNFFFFFFFFTVYSNLV